MIKASLYKSADVKNYNSPVATSPYKTPHMLSITSQAGTKSCVRIELMFPTSLIHQQMCVGIRFKGEMLKPMFAVVLQSMFANTYLIPILTYLGFFIGFETHFDLL